MYIDFYTVGTDAPRNRKKQKKKRSVTNHSEETKKLYLYCRFNNVSTMTPKPPSKTNLPLFHTTLSFATIRQ